jgi:transcriptional regulator with XRE-family HTH domain
MINIGKSLKEHREKLGLTQNQLSAQTCLTQASISRWESNENIPNVLDCIKLAIFYGISIDYLVGYENEDGTKNSL